MKNNYDIYRLYVFSSISCIILIFTNKFYSLESSSSLGFADQLEYLKIFISAPQFSEESVMPPQAQRFILMFILGSIFEFFQIKHNVYQFFVFFNFCIILLIVQAFLKIILHLKVEKNIGLIIVSALIFNAYNFRPAFFAPLMINDLLFTYGLMLLAIFFIKKKLYFFHVGLIICCFTRQTSIILNLLFLFIILYQIFSKNKNHSNLIFIYGFIFNTLIFFLTKNIAGNFSNINFSSLFDTILGLLKFDYSFLELLIFLIYILNANLFIFILIIIFFINFKYFVTKIKYETILVLILASVIWIQPILGGPSLTGNNVARLTVLSMPIFLIFFSILFKNFEINLLSTSLVILSCLVSSFHHNYTFIINNFFDFKNYHFVLLNFSLHLIILIILLNKCNLKQKQ